ncbi:MAG: type IX secretion system outer membrane channel protein PorV [Bacteroidia bacterium]|nr:type IX secretion system outer membrane channel protein PorV [Bacteroidia bacterium]
MNTFRKSFLTFVVGAFLLPLSMQIANGQVNPPPSTGQVVTTKTITTAVPFLLIAPDSRSGGLGEAGVAAVNDANAMHWNPSALAFYQGRGGVSLSYSPWLRALRIPDVNLAYISGYYNLGEKGGAIGTSLRYFSLGTINFTDVNGDPAGYGKPNEFAYDIGYARKVTEVLSASVALRYIHSNLNPTGGVAIDLKPANSVAGDLSFLYNQDFNVARAGGRMPINLKAGLNISNIGAKVTYSPQSGIKNFIPTNMKLGYALSAQLDEYNSLVWTQDINKLLVPSAGGNSSKTLLQGIFGSFGDAEGGFGEEMREINIANGLEYWYRKIFAARAGFFYEAKDKGNRTFITLGAGIKYNVFGVNFAYLAPLAQNHPLQNTLRFSLTYDFQSAGNE